MIVNGQHHSLRRFYKRRHMIVIAIASVAGFGSGNAAAMFFVKFGPT
jgi:hypothetical protein